MLHIPNAMIVETVCAGYDGWYNEGMTRPSSIRDGMIALFGKSGVDTVPREPAFHRPDTHPEYSDETHRINP